VNVICEDSNNGTLVFLIQNIKHFRQILTAGLGKKETNGKNPDGSFY
jgi:hypothetical protein